MNSITIVAPVLFARCCGWKTSYGRIKVDDNDGSND